MFLIKLTTNKQVKDYLRQYTGKFTRTTETSPTFGSFTTYYDSGNCPVLQHDIETYGAAVIYGIVGHPPVACRKVQDISHLRSQCY